MPGESKSTLIVLTAEKTSYVAQQLIENMEYLFSVRARTTVGWGTPLVGNISVGPQPGQCIHLLDVG
jgi:hypothetical protein